LFDAYHVSKPLSQQLLPFGRSGDGLEELTFGVGQFSALSVRGGQSACLWRTVRDLLFIVCSSCSCSPSFSIRCVFEVLLGEVSDGPHVPGATVRGCLADSPRAPRGRSVFRGSLLEVLLALTDSPQTRPDGPPYLCGQSVEPWRTVRLARADSPPLLAGRSARA
jgi:hypothetical protein